MAWKDWLLFVAVLLGLMVIHAVLFDNFDSHDMTQFYIIAAMVATVNAIRREQSQ